MAPVVDLLVLLLGVVEGEDGQFGGVVASEHLGDDEPVGEVAPRVPNGVGQVEPVKPLQDFSWEGGAAAHCADHLDSFYYTTPHSHTTTIPRAPSESPSYPITFVVSSAKEHLKLKPHHPVVLIGQGSGSSRMG